MEPLQIRRDIADNDDLVMKAVVRTLATDEAQEMVSRLVREVLQEFVAEMGGEITPEMEAEARRIIVRDLSTGPMPSEKEAEAILEKCAKEAMQNLVTEFLLERGWRISEEDPNIMIAPYSPGPKV